MYCYECKGTIPWCISWLVMIIHDQKWIQPSFLPVKIANLPKLSASQKKYSRVRGRGLISAVSLGSPFSKFTQAFPLMRYPQPGGKSSYKLGLRKESCQQSSSRQRRRKWPFRCLKTIKGLVQNPCATASDGRFTTDLRQALLQSHNMVHDSRGCSLAGIQMHQTKTPIAAAFSPSLVPAATDALRSHTEVASCLIVGAGKRKSSSEQILDS